MKRRALTLGLPAAAATAAAGVVLAAQFGGSAVSPPCFTVGGVKIGGVVHWSATIKNPTTHETYCLVTKVTTTTVVSVRIGSAVTVP